MKIIETANLKAKLTTPTNIILVTIGVTAIAFIESLRSFLWSPFIVIYTAVLFAIPIYLKSYRFGAFRKAWSKWQVILLGLICIKIWQTLFQVSYDYFLKTFGVAGNWHFDLFKTSNEILNQTAGKYHSIIAAILLFAITILVIPVAEEMFYRGYVFGLLKADTNNFWFAAIISSVLLALRHSAHPLFLAPYPIVSSIAWVISVIPIGLILAYIYDRTESLWPVIIIHILLNVPLIPRI